MTAHAPRVQLKPLLRTRSDLHCLSTPSSSRMYRLFHFPSFVSTCADPVLTGIGCSRACRQCKEVRLSENRGVACYSHDWTGSATWWFGGRRVRSTRRPRTL